MATAGSALPEPTPDERSYGSLAHFLQLVTAWIGPLIILIIKRESPFVKFHALQALLLQAVYLVFMVFFMVVWFGIIFGTVLADAQNHAAGNRPPVGLFIVLPLIWLVFMLGWVGMLVVSVLYGIKANRGEWANYPVLGNLSRRILHM